MAPHLKAEELDEMFRLRNEGQTPIQIHAWLEAKRGEEDIAAPNVTNVRKALKGQSFRRGQVETRGRKRKLSRRVVLKLDRTRKELIEKAKNEKEVHWGMCCAGRGCVPTHLQHPAPSRRKASTSSGGSHGRSPNETQSTRRSATKSVGAGVFSLRTTSQTARTSSWTTRSSRSRRTPVVCGI